MKNAEAVLAQVNDLQQRGVKSWRAGDDRAAVAHYDEALRLLSGTDHPDVPVAVANVKQNKALVLLPADPEAAIQLLDEAITAFRRLACEAGRADLAHLLAIACQSKATALRSLGRAEAALDLHEEAIEIWKRLVSQGQRQFLGELASIYSNRANVLEELGHFRTAVECYDRAIDVRTALVQQDGKREYLGELAKAIAYRAQVLLRLGDRATATRDFRQAASILQAEVRKTGRRDLKETLEWLVDCHADALR
jgi:tetratricopeptide (TPR) repeat protein